MLKMKTHHPIVMRDTKLLIFNKTASRNRYRASLMPIRVSTPLVNLSNLWAIVNRKLTYEQLFICRLHNLPTSNVSILLTTLSNRTTPLFVANIKDENSTRYTSAITIVNNWHTSIAHTLRSGSSQRGSRRVVPQTTLPRRGEDCIVRSMSYEQPFIRSHATCQTEQIRHSLQTYKITTCNRALLRTFSDCNLPPLRPLTPKNFQKIRTNPHSRRAIS